MESVTVKRWLKGGSVLKRIAKCLALGSCFLLLGLAGQRGTHPALLLGVVGSSILFTVTSLPSAVDNGMMFELLVHINLATSLVHHMYLAGGSSPGGSSWAAIRDASSGCQGLLVLLYLFAGVAKLNSDYFNVRRSSTSVFVLLIGDSLGSEMGLRPRHVRMVGDRVLLFALSAAVYAVVCVELTIPGLFLLGTPTSIFVGAVLDWAFHLKLAIAAFDFSSIVVATLMLWAAATPAELVNGLGFLAVSPLARGVCIALALFVFLCDLPRRTTQILTPLHLIAMLWLASCSPLLYLSSSADPTVATVAAPPALLVRQAAAFTLALAVANGVSAYTGHKTHATFTMFSNLRVEGGTNNHFFIPGALARLGWARDIVTVTRTNLPVLQSFHKFTGGVAKLRFLREFAERQAVNAAIHSNGVQGGAGELATLLPFEVPLFQLRVVVFDALASFSDDEKEEGWGFFVEYETPGGTKARFEVRDGAIVADDGGVEDGGWRLGGDTAPPWLARKLTCFRSCPACSFSPVGFCSH